MASVSLQRPLTPCRWLWSNFSIAAHAAPRTNPQEAMSITTATIHRTFASELASAIDRVRGGILEKRLRQATVKVNGRLTRCAGRAHVSGQKTGLVEISGPLFRHELSTMDELCETIRHELAHIAVGPGHGHDVVWRQTARAFGSTGDRCHQMPAYVARRAGTTKTVTLTCKVCSAEVWKGERKSVAKLRTKVARSVTLCCNGKIDLDVSAN